MQKLLLLPGGNGIVALLKVREPDWPNTQPSQLIENHISYVNMLVDKYLNIAFSLVFPFKYCILQEGTNHTYIHHLTFPSFTQRGLSRCGYFWNLQPDLKCNWLPGLFLTPMCSRASLCFSYSLLLFFHCHFFVVLSLSLCCPWSSSNIWLALCCQQTLSYSNH